MPRTPRTRVAEGIYRDAYSLIGIARVGSGKTALYREKAFDLDEPYEDIERWRERMRVELHEERPRNRRGTFNGSVSTYLDRAKKTPASWASKRSELKAWRKARVGRTSLGEMRFHTIKPEHIDKIIGDWIAKGVAKKTVQNRCRTLHHLYVVLANDKKARTPLDNIDVPKPSKRRPVMVDVETIKRVEENLRRGDRKTRGRFMVMAATGIRPSQLGRVLPTDVNLDRRVILIEGGKGGEPIAHVLNNDMLGAWKVFIAANAYGPFDSTEFAREIRAAGWPAGVRIYNYKHSVGIELAERGADARDIQAWFGHTDDATTKIYTGVPLSRMRRLAETIEGRLGWQDAATDTPRDTPRSDARKSRKSSKRRKGLPKLKRAETPDKNDAVS